MTDNVLMDAAIIFGTMTIILVLVGLWLVEN